MFSGVPTRSDTNRAVQPLCQQMTRGLISENVTRWVNMTQSVDMNMKHCYPTVMY